MNYFEIFFAVLVWLTLIPVTVLFIQVLAALLQKNGQYISKIDRLHITVLVPAHNEALGIRKTLNSVQCQLRTGDRIIVIADNCTDETEVIAISTGAEVIVRNEEERRGKGYALDFGVRYLNEDPPDIVIVVDADCQLHEGTIDRLAHLCFQVQRPVQALYLMHTISNAGLQARLAEFAWVVKNWVRPLGLRRLNLPCQLMGTGMAFPWKLIRSAELANANIVEDMKLGLDLALLGFPALFCPEAIVSSHFPASVAGTKSQQTRWQHGHISTILSELPNLLIKGLWRRDFRLVGLAVDLMIPPLALFGLMLSGLFVFSLVWAWMGLSTLPLILLSVEIGMVTAAVLISWHNWGRSIISSSELVKMPLYMLAKFPIYAAFLIKRQKKWVRTNRE